MTVVLIDIDFKCVIAVAYFGVAKLICKGTFVQFIVPGILARLLLRLPALTCLNCGVFSRSRQSINLYWSRPQGDAHPDMALDVAIMLP